jgi:PelA/Pel-15E family pectate lyase
MIRSKLKKLSFTLAFALILGTSGVAIQHPVTVFAGTNSQAYTLSVSDILKYQNIDGGWSKGYDEADGEWKNSTIDNGLTHSEIRRLASEYTKTKNNAYSIAAIRGINCLLNMQYKTNGGWPQVANGTGYHTHITYNDDAMISVMILLDEVANKKGDFSFVDSTLAAKCKTAVDNGVNCLLKTQIVDNGKLTIWGQQHDENTLKPTGARAYEIPSLCSKESVGIVKFLKTRPTTTQIATSIKAAEDWFKTTKITGIEVVKVEGKDKNGKKVTIDAYIKSNPKASPIWARFYELGTNKPLFSNRKGDKLYELKAVEQERRAGYSWYGSGPSELVK